MCRWLSRLWPTCRHGTRRQLLHNHWCMHRVRVCRTLSGDTYFIYTRAFGEPDGFAMFFTTYYRIPMLQLNLLLYFFQNFLHILYMKILMIKDRCLVEKISDFSRALLNKISPHLLISFHLYFQTIYLLISSCNLNFPMHCFSAAKLQ